MVARAIHLDAKVLILDEPTEAFAPPEVDALFAVVRELRDRGMGIVYVSHRLSEVFSIADTVTVLRDGTPVIDGVPLGDTTADAVVAAIVSQGGIPASGTASEVEPAPEVAGSGRTPEGYGPKVATMSSLGGGRTVDLHQGQVVGLAGLVGAGRSSLLKQVAGLDKSVSTRPGVTFLPEDRAQLGLLHGLTVRENITISQPSRLTRRALRSFSQRKERRLCLGAMRQVGLAESAMEARIESLSGGNQQKALLARGLFEDAALWLLDEPTVGLDVQARRQVLGLVKKVSRGQVGLGADGHAQSAAVLTSSDLDDLIETCDVVYVVRQGQLRDHLSSPFSEEQLTMLTAFSDGDARES